MTTLTESPAEEGNPTMPSGGDTHRGLEFPSLVEQYYQHLFKFALSLTRSESDACDLTQQTFYIWLTKGEQLRDHTKVKTWLFTTLHRGFLQLVRRQRRFPHFDLEDVSSELPRVLPPATNHLDSEGLLAAVAKMDALFHAPVALFYLEQRSYKEIAAILEVPIGTVKSRIARGIAQLQKILATHDCLPQRRN